MHVHTHTCTHMHRGQGGITVERVHLYFYVYICTHTYMHTYALNTQEQDTFTVIGNTPQFQYTCIPNVYIHINYTHTLFKDVHETPNIKTPLMQLTSFDAHTSALSFSHALLLWSTLWNTCTHVSIVLQPCLAPLKHPLKHMHTRQHCPSAMPCSSEAPSETHMFLFTLIYFKQAKST